MCNLFKCIEDDPDMLYFIYSYDSDYKKCKFKTTNTGHVEMNRTAKRQIYKSHKGITLAKKKDLLMLCTKELIPKQYHTLFNSTSLTTSGGKKDDIGSNSDSNSGKINLLIHIKIG